jgi:hypothetical protein
MDTDPFSEWDEGATALETLERWAKETEHESNAPNELTSMAVQDDSPEVRQWIAAHGAGLQC